jgi:polysaccharide biosynthesis/export protein VpsN
MNPTPSSRRTTRSDVSGPTTLQSELYSKAHSIALLTLFLTLSQFTQAAPSSEYQLGSGDLISIQVFGEEDLSMEVKLSNQPTISYPFLGNIAVLDNTISEVETTIINGLKGDYLLEPRVNVSVKEYRPFFITGEVEEPGAYPFQPGLTLRKAISLAGGFTERASKTKMFKSKKDLGESGNKEARDLIKLQDPISPDDVITIEQSFF